MLLLRLKGRSLKELTMKQIFVINLISFSTLPFDQITGLIEGTTSVVVALTNAAIAIYSLRKIIKKNKKDD